MNNTSRSTRPYREARGDRRHPLTGVTAERLPSDVTVDEAIRGGGWGPYYIDLASGDHA